MYGVTRLADVCAAVKVEPECGRPARGNDLEYDRAVAELRAHLAELG